MKKEKKIHAVFKNLTRQHSLKEYEFVKLNAF